MNLIYVKKSFFLSGLFLIFALSILAQQDGQIELAQQFLANGEYEKAKVIYEQLYQKNDHDLIYLDYYKTLIALGEFESLERIVLKRMKKYPKNLKLYLDLGKLYADQNDKPQSEKAFNDAIAKVIPTQGPIVQLANEFIRMGRYDLAISTYLKGRKELKREDLFRLQLASMYQRNGDYDLFVAEYLEALVGQPRQVQSLKNAMLRSADKQAAYNELEKQLYEKIQKDNNSTVYPELLAWLFMQQDDYESALIQLKALDRRFSEDGIRLLTFAITAAHEERYDEAMNAFEYLLEKGTTSVHYFAARKGMLDAGKNKIQSNPNYTQEDLMTLKNSYEELIQDLGVNSQTAQLIKDYSQLAAFYLHDLNLAVDLIQQVLDLPHISENLRAQAKIDLGDYYLLSGERWEAMLLYGQVDKALKDSPIGELARFKNAKIHYYNGEFGLAQYQLKVLKSATSELVANDALDLSIFITDNLGLDSILDPMLIFARADLLIFQNKDQQALQTLDTIDFAFPNHFLSDDIMFKRGELAVKAHDYALAVTHFQNVYDQHPTDLLADNALFKLGEMHQFFLNDLEKAQQYYETIILDFPDSIFITEARKRFRKLRGDNL